MKILHLIFLVLVTLLFPGIVLAEEILFSSTISSVDSKAFPKIHAKVNIFTRKRVPVLSKDNLVLKEDGADITDFSVTVDEEPVYVSLVLDRSGSMSNAIGGLKKAACEFVDTMDGKAYCQLISFSTAIKKHCSFSNVPKYLKKKISGLNAFGATALYDAVAEGIESLHTYPTHSRKVVIAFTDGVDQNAARSAQQSKISVRSLVKKARKKKIPIYIIGLGSEVNRKLMTKVAALTKGSFLYASDSRRLSRMFSKVAKMVDVGYSISYKTPKPQADGSWRHLVISSQKAGKKDQGRGKYKAPSKAAESKPVAKATVKSAQGIPLEMSPTEFLKKGLQASLIESKFIFDYTDGLEDVETVTDDLRAIIQRSNESLRQSYAKANAAWGPVLANCVQAIANNKFETLKPLVKQGQTIAKELDDEVEEILANYRQQMKPYESQMVDRGARSQFHRRFLYVGNVSRGITSQTHVLHLKLFANNHWNNTYRGLIEAFNKSVQMHYRSEE